MWSKNKQEEWLESCKDCAMAVLSVVETRNKAGFCLFLDCTRNKGRFLFICFFRLHQQCSESLLAGLGEHYVVSGCKPRLAPSQQHPLSHKHTLSRNPSRLGIHQELLGVAQNIKTNKNESYMFTQVILHISVLLISSPRRRIVLHLVNPYFFNEYLSLWNPRISWCLNNLGWQGHL